MNIFRRIRLTPGTVLACIALAIALGGSSYAAVSALPANSVTSVQVKDHSLLPKDFRTLPKGPRGPAGPAGPAGAAGPAGPAGPAGGGAAAKWALVKPDGTIAAQSGGLTVSSHSTGVYILDFGGAINQKLLIATAGLASDSAARGDVIVGPCGGTAEGFVCPASNDTNHVIVRTYNAANAALADHSFYVAQLG